MTKYNIWFAGCWFAASLTALLFALLFSFYLKATKQVNPYNQNFKLYAAVPKSETVITDYVRHVDARAKIIENFFTDYKSPLAVYGNTFVAVADKYRLDYKLLPAISMQESNGGKKVVNNSFNPFGYGIYGSLVIKFNSWEEAIERVGKALREDYLNQGLENPYQIMAKYTPPSLAKDGAWAKGVVAFMEELQ
ncbi:glucosaminidase domain-containing protein [Patescibacteria group bacterium]|nr:glucosaminidase domain-containing protein [Patescibacteria group bacterium]